ncbi:MAG: hypothetical protein AAGJ31_11925, partial [Verrucomicrobiota bacterium]
MGVSPADDLSFSVEEVKHRFRFESLSEDGATFVLEGRGAKVSGAVGDELIAINGLRYGLRGPVA